MRFNSRRSRAAAPFSFLLARAPQVLEELARTLPDPASASGLDALALEAAPGGTIIGARGRVAPMARQISACQPVLAPATGEAGTALDALCGELLAVASRDPAGCVADVDAAPSPVDAAALRDCLLYTSPSPRDKRQSRMPSSA